MICGTMILKKTWNGLAPSMIAASMVSSGHAAQGGRQDHHGEPGLDPDQDDHQEKVVPERHLQRIERLGAHEGAQRVDDPDLGVNGVDEAPDQRGAHEGDRHRHEDDRFREIAPRSRSVSCAITRPRKVASAGTTSTQRTLL
jgi:hypothetical protein